jgi:UDP-3-O-[3-hydroxymyristoyl] N-acetylglucosamine deacetylase / 3-hydroxyacyl-[acyl-carrier-protein] dehydratase
VNRRQRTISLEAEIEGHGLFTGQTAHLRFKPAAPNTGLVFNRVDLGPTATVAASIQSVAKRFQRTTLANGEVMVETAEHLLASLSGLGIDNLIVELNGPELPAGDGSAADYVRLLRQAGIVEQDAVRPVFRIMEPVTVQEGDAIITALPGPEDELALTYDLDYGASSIVPAQVFHLKLTPDSFVSELAASRTFILDSEVAGLRQRGYGPQASYEDLLVIGPQGPIGNTYRFPDEPSRHKMLDLVGDLFLTNCDLRGRIVAMRSGHTLNHRLVRRLLEQASGMGAMRRGTIRQVLDINQIMAVIPHRYPFLLLDRVIELEEGARAVGLKNVTFNEHFFQGHYPGTPIMPGVLIIEAMAQLSGVLLLQKLSHRNQVASLISMDKVKLRKPVHPGDQLRLEVEVVRSKARTAEVFGRAWIGDELAAEARIRFMLVPAEQES